MSILNRLGANSVMPRPISYTDRYIFDTIVASLLFADLLRPLPCMSQLPSSTPTSEAAHEETPTAPESPQPSYVKLAMRNMVRKRGTSLFHFFLTTIVLVSILVSLACLDRYVFHL